jgi:hypothetical protein
LNREEVLLLLEQSRLVKSRLVRILISLDTPPRSSRQPSLVLKPSDNNWITVKLVITSDFWSDLYKEMMSSEANLLASLVL